MSYKRVTRLFCLAHGIGAATAPVTSAILKFTDVFVPIGMGSGTLPVWFAILDFADAFASPEYWILWWLILVGTRLMVSW